VARKRPKKEKKPRTVGRVVGDIVVTIIVIALLGTAAYLLYKEFFPNNTPILKMQVTNTADKSIDWAALRAKNPETVGWLTIDGTNIDTPVVQTTDNNKYLHTDFSGNYDERGVPFLDMDYKWNPRSRNSVIYGHSTMRSGVKVLFDDLLNYVKDPSFIQKHGAITYDRPPEMGGNGTWAIFGVLLVEANVDYRSPDFASEDAFVAYYQQLKAASQVQTDVTVNAGDEVLTLSTCIFNTGLNDGRLVILAKRVK
jgi:sortase B